MKLTGFTTFLAEYRFGLAAQLRINDSIMLQIRRDRRASIPVGRMKRGDISSRTVVAQEVARIKERQTQSDTGRLCAAVKGIGPMSEP